MLNFHLPHWMRLLQTAAMVLIFDCAVVPTLADGSLYMSEMLGVKEKRHNSTRQRTRQSKAIYS